MLEWALHTRDSTQANHVPMSDEAPFALPSQVLVFRENGNPPTVRIFRAWKVAKRIRMCAEPSTK